MKKLILIISLFFFQKTEASQMFHLICYTDTKEEIEVFLDNKENSYIKLPRSKISASHLDSKRKITKYEINDETLVATYKYDWISNAKISINRLTGNISGGLGKRSFSADCEKYVQNEKKF